MEDEKVPIGKLDRDNLEGDSALVRPEEEDSIASARNRVREVDRVRAVLDDERGSILVDAVTQSRPCKLESHSMASFSSDTMPTSTCPA